QMLDGAEHEQHAGGELDQEVAHSGSIRALAAPCPDEEYRGDCGELPEHEEREQVARKNGAERRAGVGKPRGRLNGVSHMQAVDGGKERRDQEHPAEDEAPAVGTHEEKLLAEKRELAVL